LIDIVFEKNEDEKQIRGGVIRDALVLAESFVVVV